MALIVQTFGVVGTLSAATIAVRSYVNSNKRSQETRDRDLETRQAQLFMNLFNSFINEETLKIDFELMEWRWKDFDDYEAKYGSKNNPEATVKMHSLHYRLDCVGWLVKCGVIDPEWVYNQLGGFILYHWLKFKSIIYEDRKRTGLTNYYENFEHLAGVCDGIGKVKGSSLETIRVGNSKWFSEQSSVD